MQPHLPQAIEAILFATAEPMTYAALAKLLDASIDNIGEAVTELKATLDGHGIILTELNQVVSLATSSEFSGLIESMRKEELSKELSKASAETLAVIAYIPGATKSQIEFIRGVNASYSLRALSMRGLIESKGAGRAVTYHPTLELLTHYGITRIEELPNYRDTKAKLEALLGSQSTTTE